MSINRNPIRIDGVRVTGDMYVISSLRCKDKNPKPVPTSKLNEGPAKQPEDVMILDKTLKQIDVLAKLKQLMYLPVVAMSGMPFFAIAIFADRSPIELPHASTVIPKIGLGILVNVPKNSSILTSLPMTSIHVAAMKKPYSDSGTEATSGILSSSV
mmetsp:Transcript_12670/g.24748  ORF Transcript_12670/g.24748 Transcript_12670/m.24748 type:complete len:156 (-) Transcript_12670:1870-2337(-)